MTEHISLIDDETMNSCLETALIEQSRGEHERSLIKYSYLGEGARNFLRLTRHPDYQGFRRELQLIELMSEELRSLGATHMLDLGPGDGLKARRIMEIIGGDTQYAAIDLSPEMLSIAEQNVASITQERGTFIRGDFGDPGLLRSLRMDQGSNRLVLLLGNTVANEPDLEAYIEMIRQNTVSPGRRTFILLGIELYDEDIQSILREYINEENTSLSVQPLHLAGLDTCHDRFSVTFNETRRRIEEWFAFSDGARVLLSSTQKPDEKTWEKIMSSGAWCRISQQRIGQQVLTLLELL